MKIKSFGYRGHYVFSQPIIQHGSENNLLVLATAFGPQNSMEKAIEEFVREFENQKSDPDITSPYPKLTCLDDIGNSIYTSIQFLNDYIYSNHNKDRYSLACDLICIYRTKKSIYFSQVGWPLIALYQRKKLIPISSEYCFAPAQAETAPFLPANLVGLESSLNFKVQQIDLAKDSELLILKSNNPADSLTGIYPNSLEKIAEVFAMDAPEQGFWLGQVSL